MCRICKVVAVFLFFTVFVQAQYDFSSNTAHVSIVKAIEINNDIIKERTANFEKKTQAKPLMFVNVKKKISELNRISNNVSIYIEKLQSEVSSERVLYELLEDDFYDKLLFVNETKLSAKGEKLKIKIDSLYQIGKNINIHKLSLLNDFVNEHFNTSEVYYDAEERKINYFQHFFYDRSNYGMMMNMNYMMLDIKLFQLLYYRTVMSY